MPQPALDIQQPSFPGMCPIEDAVKKLSIASIEERGAIYTRREVVEFILDLIGYTTNKALHKTTILEPAFGEGDFLLTIVERLLQSWKRHSRRNSSPVFLSNCIRAVELHEDSYSNVRQKLLTLLSNNNIEHQNAIELVDAWLISGDFLLTDLPASFDYAVGNPPYVRHELIPEPLIAEYRRRYATIYDRADLYIPFIERSLSLLTKSGTLGFICSDRWTKNKYGFRLRQMIAESYHLKIYVDMVDTDAFHEKVSTYPAITIITRENPGTTRIARRPEIKKPYLQSLTKTLKSSQPVTSSETVKEITGVASGSTPWILESTDQLRLVRQLESEFPTIEDTGCQVGIGVATGADKAFIAPYNELDIESDRKLRLVMTKDILSGQVKWRGYGIINPFAEDGKLVSLKEYPKLRRYLEDHKEQIVKRHVAKKRPENWYRTIDRIHPSISKKPKLLIPDIKGDAHIVYEKGDLYPHHNLYYIISDNWDLKALQAVLMSGIARLFVSTYSTQMRGGYLRFQAQYLRRIRIPHWTDVPDKLRHDLIDAAKRQDIEACNEAVFSLYGLSKEAREALEYKNSSKL